jgi:hypothetical protein
MRSMIAACAMLLLIGSQPALAKSSNGNGNGNSASAGNNGNQGCSSIGGSGANPGEWYKSLSENPLLAGLTPAEMAELENTTPGYEGYGETPSVGAAIQNSCKN